MGFLRDAFFSLDRAGQNKQTGGKAAERNRRAKPEKEETMSKRAETQHKSAPVSLRNILAVDAAKAVHAAEHLLGRQGTALPGKAALTIAPSVLQDLAGQVRKTTFAVCGTNGKTTVNNLLCAFLEAEGHTVVCNRLGANMLNGIAAAFAEAADHTGRLEAAYACLEVDEASALRVFAYVRPDYLILTNLFRDQLDRYGEIDLMMEKLEAAIRQVPDLKLIINADDPLSVYLAQKSGHPYCCYGISEPTQDGEQTHAKEVREGRFCKYCGALLAYEFYHYSQMGVWRCPQCGFSRPDPVHTAAGILHENGLTFYADGQPVRTGMQGLYTVYNILAVISALAEDGHGGKEELFQTVLDRYQPQFGRSERFRIGRSCVLLNLAKNPAGFNQNIAAVLEDRSPKDLIIAINDNEQDGTDVSWLWDVDFDRMRDESIRSVTVSGIRALDMQLRLKYVEIPSLVSENTEEAIARKLEDGCGNLYVLVNYTALFAAHRYLKKKEEEV